MRREISQLKRVPAGLLTALVLLVVLPASAQTVQQKRDFEAARVALDAGQFDFAEKRFGEFVTANPDSPLVPEARLKQAQALLRMGRFDDSLSLLNERLPQAGTLADQYAFWIAEGLFAKGEIAAAEAAFAALINRHPESALLLSAAVRQAFTLYQRRDFARTAELLAAPDGAFERARSREPASLPAMTGLLLLAESRFELGQMPEAEATLGLLPAEGLATRPAWRRLALLSRVLMATNRTADAANLIPQLLAAAAATDEKELVAESNSLAAEILERLERREEALAAIQKNLQPDVGMVWRREALVRGVNLALAVKGPDGTAQWLEQLTAEGLDEPARDLTQLTLGDLRLQQFIQLPAALRNPPGPLDPAVTNIIATARQRFNAVITGYTNSPYLGRAWLNRGWCDWHLGEWAPAAVAFREASTRLPAGLDVAVSVFKQGDSLYQLGQFDAALTNYGRVVREFGELPEVKDGLLDQAYYQMISAAVKTGNRAEAEYAVSAVLGLFPGNFYAERGLLLVGQFLNEVRAPARARAVLEEFGKRFDGSTLEPERELAIARTFVSEENWPEAINIFDRWVARHTNHVSLPVAEFDRAFALSQSGQEAQALTAFTNFVARFSTNPLVPKALLKIGRHYDTRQEFQEAERYYQLIFTGASTNWPVTSLTYEARVAASRAAFRRQGFADARRYLTDFINKAAYLTNFINESACPVEARDSASAGCCPLDLFAEALFALGDVIIAEPSEDVRRFGTARTAFERITVDYPATALVPAAFGRIGDCNLQLKLYPEATNAYLASIQHPRATVSERSLAEIGVGQVMEKLAEAAPPEEQGALLAAAQERYLNVFLQTNLRVAEGELPDASLLQVAGMNAARLAENRGDWQGAASLYGTLLEMLPALKEYLEPSIRKAQDRARSKASG